MASVLLINEPPLQVLPSLAVAIGLNEAIIVQQIHYWLNPHFNRNYFEGRYWVYNTYEKWQQQFPFWGEKTIRRVIANLENSKVLLSFITRDFKKTKYYTIDYDRLNEISQSPTRTPENLSNSPSSPNDPIDRDTRNFPSRQMDLISGDTMIRSSIDTEITPEITPPPLTPPPGTQGDKNDDEDDEKNIPEAMLEIWNRLVQSKQKLPAISHLSPRRRQVLVAFLEEMFHEDLQGFEAYCRQIGNCRFLTGENPNRFRATLEWALNTGNAYRVLEGVFYDKSEPSSKASPASSASPRIADISAEAFLSQLQQNTKDHPHQRLWLAISRAVADKLGQLTYTSWFTKLRLTRVEDNALTFDVDSAFARDYIRSHYLTAFEEAVRRVNAAIKTLRFEVKSPAVSTLLKGAVS